MQITARGTWPGPITLRQGWAKAVARQWNDDLPDAQIRLVRGSSSFIRAATDHLIAIGSPAVASPPLPEVGTAAWRRVGFGDYLELDLYALDLAKAPPRAEHPVVTGGTDEWSHVVSIDRAAFDERWRLGAVGLEEARRATSRSETLLLRCEDGVAGFAIVGVSGPVSYLQRVAVVPEQRGRGFGRSLVRSAARWGRSRGARSMMLNTQPENEPASALYRSEGFQRMPAGLKVLRRGAPD